MPVAPRDPKAFGRWFQLDYFNRPRELRRWYKPVLYAVLLLTVGVAAVAMVCVFYRPASHGRLRKLGDRLNGLHDRGPAIFESAHGLP